MKTSVLKGVSIVFFVLGSGLLLAQDIEYTMPEETSEHEGTWIQWPHNELYPPWYIEDVEPTFIAMTDALQEGENVHIIALNAAELDRIQNVLADADVPFDNLDFFIYPTDDVWSRDNGPVFVYDENNDLTILDWGFNGWGLDTPYENCDVIPTSVGEELDIPVIDLNAMVLEGGAVEHDGHGTMMATRSSITHSSRNPDLSEQEIEDYMTTYLGFTNFIWLDGVYRVEITDMHIDGFVKFANDSTIITMPNPALSYWYVSPDEIDIINGATNADGEPYNIVTVPLTQNNVVTTYQDNLGYKGSYVNYYIGNEVVLVPTYSDPRDQEAMYIIQGIHPNRTVIGIDVRNLYAYGGMIHCITQQQPVSPNPDAISEEERVEPYQLGQNSPNPAMDLTVINFSTEHKAPVSIEVRSLLGQHIETITSVSGKGSVALDVSKYSHGFYTYSLIVEGRAVATKQMIVE